MKMNSPVSDSISPVRLEPRISFGMQFEYVDDFDENGIIHWISTDGLSKSWENSHKTGLVKVRLPLRLCCNRFSPMHR